jgi:hypothetical protein
MTKLERSALGEAVAERVMSLALTDARLRALDDRAESDPHVVGEPDAEKVLLGALHALSTRSGYESARRIMAGEHVQAGDELARAGLALWDPASDSMRPTALLVELMRVFESALDEAQQGA